MSFKAALATLPLLLAAGLHAAAPTLEHFYPVAVPRGTTNSVAAIGKFDPWPPKIWVDAPGIAFNAETNSGKLTLTIATNAAVGPHLIRLFNDQGASAPRFLIVTDEPQAEEREPNDDFRKPQAPDRFPVSLNGRLDKSGDVDSFAVPLEAGQTVTASVEAYTLGSPLDPVLRLVDSRGVQMAFNHDDGRTLDPFLGWTASAPGTYVLQVFGFVYPANSDVKLSGGNSSVYRLHVSRGPVVHHTLPLGVQAGAKTKLRLSGWNLGSREGSEFEFDGTALPPGASGASLKIPGVENTLHLPAGPGPAHMEHEPNGTFAEANPIEIPSAVTGCIEKTGDEDRFRFTAKKDQKLLIEIQSASLGFPLDAWLKIEDAVGKELARSDDGVTADPALDWTAPADGAYAAAVGNVLHRGGPDHLYRLSLRPALPGLEATVAENTFSIAPGKTNEIKVSLKRLRGFQSKLSISARNLPPGVTATNVAVTEKEAEAVLKLVSTAAAKPFSGLFQIVATEPESKKEHAIVNELVTSTVNNGVPNGFNHLVIESTAALWLTVLPPKPAEETPKK
jgi:hypothetical protein